jgi:hypothetical protein
MMLLLGGKLLVLLKLVTASELTTLLQIHTSITYAQCTVCSTIMNMQCNHTAQRSMYANKYFYNTSIAVLTTGSSTITCEVVRSGMYAHYCGISIKVNIAIAQW